jgi:hypothetical protein
MDIGSERIKMEELIGKRIKNVFVNKWGVRLDLNQRPLAYETNELPDCSTYLLESITFISTLKKLNYHYLC